MSFVFTPERTVSKATINQRQSNAYFAHTLLDTYVLKMFKDLFH